MTDEDRLDELESVVEAQQETIERQRERLDRLETERADAEGKVAEEGSGDADRSSSALSRRGILHGLGLAGLVSLGAGTATADEPRGVVGSGDHPVDTLYLDTLSGTLTGGTDLTTLAGDGLVIANDTLETGSNGPTVADFSQVVAEDADRLSFEDNLDVRDGEDGVQVTASDSNSQTDVSDDGTTVVSSTSDIDFGDNLVATDDGDGSATVDADVQAATNWVGDDTTDLLEPASPYTGIQSASGNALTFHTDGGARTLKLGAPATSFLNTAGGNVIAGHPDNAVNNDAVGVVIGGGGAANGNENSVGGNYATVGGGLANTASGLESTVGGGDNNTASGQNATVGGGRDNTASGLYATIGGGENNTASGDYSFVAGRLADTNGHSGAFVFGDSTRNPVRANADDEAFFQMPVNGNFSVTSSRSEKTDVEPVSPTDVLAGVLNLDVTTWEYTNTDESRHIGPMAEDFDDEFGFGRSADRINTVDADGVALAAIQGLAQKLDEKDERIADLAKDTDDLRAENDRLRERVAELEARLASEGAGEGPNADSARGATGD